MKKIKLGPKHPSLIDTYNRIGLLSCKIGGEMVCITNLKQAVDIWTKNIKIDNDYYKILKNIININNSSNKNNINYNKDIISRELHKLKKFVKGNSTLYAM